MEGRKRRSWKAEGKRWRGKERRREERKGKISWKMKGEIVKEKENLAERSKRRRTVLFLCVGLISDESNTVGRARGSSLSREQGHRDSFFSRPGLS